MLIVKTRLRGDVGGLAANERRDRLRQRGIANPVRAVRERGRQTALELVLALRARLEQGAAPLDGAFDQPVVAELEVQHLEVLEAAPVAAVKVGALLEV